MRSLLVLIGLVASVPVATQQRGVELANLTWVEAEKVLAGDQVVVIPLGAASKEHGPHLRLDNDYQLAEYFKRRVLSASAVVVAPTISYHFYPAFLEYPGSTHLRTETARDLVVDIVTSLAPYGPRRFYVLNTGVSTIAPLKASADELAKAGLIMRFTDVLTIASTAEATIKQQPEGTHADEIETSMMLYIAPDRVDMSKAAKDISPREGGRGGLTRVQGRGVGRYSPTGIYGDATLATRDKGRVVVEAMVEGILREIDDLRRAPLPVKR
jgi:creatinine amidohydrolase